MATFQSTVAGFSVDRLIDLSDRQTQERYSRAGRSAFFKIVEAWRVRDEDARQLLGGVSNGMYYQLKSGQEKTLNQDELTRISLLVGIFKALNILYSRKLADAWIGLPNSNAMFGGDTPLTYLIHGGVPAFIRVRQLLDARRGNG